MPGQQAPVDKDVLNPQWETGDDGLAATDLEIVDLLDIAAGEQNPVNSKARLFVQASIDSLQGLKTHFNALIAGRHRGNDTRDYRGDDEIRITTDTDIRVEQSLFGQGALPYAPPTDGSPTTGHTNPVVAAAVEEWVNANYVTEMPKATHVKNAARHLLGEPIVRVAYTSVPDYEADDDSAFQVRVYDTQEQTQLHSCRATCIKKSATRSGRRVVKDDKGVTHVVLECRFAMPHAPRAETKLVYLTNTMSDDGKTIKTVTATEDTEAIPHEDYAHRQDRDRHIAPLCVPDLRALVLEPRNPQLYPDGPVTWTDIRNDLDIQHDAVLLSYLDRLDANLRDGLLKKVPSRNQLLVTVHPVVCGVLGANTANVFNGATTQAKSTLYYTVRNRSIAPLYLTIHPACIHSLLC